MKNFIITFVGIIILVSASFFIFRNSGNKVSQTGNDLSATTSPILTTIESKSYSLEDIATHDNKEDCWLAIEGKVYDVTEFISSGRHPGRDAILQGCGKDATTLFNTRPMGSKTPHSSQARSMLDGFEIGILSP